MTYPFYFKVKLYLEDNYYFQSGIGLCSNFSDAARQLEENYIDDLFSIEHIELMEDGPLLCMPDEICQKIVNDPNYDALVKIQE